MRNAWAGRAVGVLILLTVLFGLMVGFGMLTPAPNHGAYPSGSDLAADYDAYSGQPVQVEGTVVRTDPVVIAVKYEYYAAGEAHRGILELTITDTGTAVKPGQIIQVYGVAQSDRTIAARNVVSIPARNVVYMYSVSALAGVWVLTRLVRDWQIDWQTGALTRRPHGLAFVAPIMAALREVVD